MGELGRVLLYEATKECLQTVETNVMTPLAETTVEVVDPTKPIKVKYLPLYARCEDYLP